MDKQATAIVSYIGIVGLIVAICAGDRQGAKQHLNQNIVLQIINAVYGVFATIVSAILGFTIVGLIFLPIVLLPFLVIMVFMVWGFINAIRGDDTPLPIIGGIQIIK